MLDLLFGPPARAAAITLDSDIGWTGNGLTRGMRTRAGVTVSEDVALTYEAVFRATCVLAEGVGGVPLPLYERVSETDRKTASLDVGELLKFMPNPDMTASVFRESRTAHQVNWPGGGFAEIERDARTMRIIALWPIHPSRVEKPPKESEYQYWVRNDDGKRMGMYADEMLHIPGTIPDDGIWSKGVISYGRECIGGGMGVDRTSYQIVGAGGPSKGLLIAPGMNDRTKKAEFRKEWNEVHGNPEVNAPTIAIIPAGWEYKDIGGLGGEANQMIQTRVVNKSNIATLYGIPAYKINAEGKETAGTIEQKAIEFVVYSLMPWAKKWEEQCNFKLLSPDERKQFYFEHKFDALMRGDKNNRYNAYQKGLSFGYLTINQVCQLENLPNIGPAGDEHYMPANLTTAERVMRGDMGNGGGLGSDSTRSPAQAPPGPADSEEAFHKWAKTLTTTMRGELNEQLKTLLSRMEDRKIDYTGVARQALLDALDHIFTKESNAALHAAKDKTVNFEAWAVEFYAKNHEWAKERIRTSFMALDIAGVKRWADRADLVSWLAARSMQELKSSYNTDTPIVFSRKLAAWPTERAAVLADEILKG